MDTEKSSGLDIVYSAKALKQLDEIWNWNEERYNASHADQYVEFLERHINAPLAWMIGRENGSAIAMI